MAPPARPARVVKLLLDEMHAPSVAKALRADGHDVVAVSKRAELRGRSDEEVLLAAVAESWAVVTENARDFVPLASAWGAVDRAHAGLVLTSPRRFDRARMAYPGDLIDALATFLDDLPVGGASWTWWL